MSKQNGQQRREQHNIHQRNLSRPADEEGQAPETLKFIASPEKEIEAPVPGMDWIESKSTSTTNLTEADVESREWVIEYFGVLSRLSRPPEYGLTHHLRAWAFDDRDEFAEPLGTEGRMKIEGAVEVGKEAAARSKEGWATETATKDTKESIVQSGEEEQSSGGLLGRLRD